VSSYRQSGTHPLRFGLAMATSSRIALVAVMMLWSNAGQSQNQSTSPPDPFARIAFLSGRWEGASGATRATPSFCVS